MRLKSIFLCAGFVLLHLVSKADISIYISKPDKYEAVTNGFTIHADVTSTYELASVIANIDTVQSTLIYNRNESYYSGTISLKSFRPFDTLKITVTAMIL